MTDTERSLQSRARRVAREKVAPLARDHDEARRFPEAQIRALAEDGLLAMLCPVEHGGSGEGSFSYSLAITEIAQACASTAVTMAVTNMVADAISAWGSESQQRQYIPRLAGAEFVAGSFALSEPEAGSDAASLMTTAERTDDGYVLNGTKCWITSGDRAGVVLVMAKTDPEAGSRGISAFLVEPDTPGFSVGRHEEKMGLRASSTVTLSLDGVRVPKNQRLGPEGVGFKVAMRALDGGRIGVGSQSLGIGLAAFEAARRYVLESRPDRARDPDVRDRLARVATELDAARLLILRAARMKDANVPFTKEASMAKLFASEAANRACIAAVEVLGPDAVDPAYDVERYARDVRVTTIYEGTSEIQRLVIARQVLAEAS